MEEERILFERGERNISLWNDGGSPLLLLSFLRILNPERRR